jgi:pimeloyl-ACP methyl ester carboxylesterase
VVDPISVEGGLAVYRMGKGESILLIPTPHGCATAAEIDKPLAHSLIEAGFEVITFDPPGAFRSTRKPAVSMDEMIGCCEEALDRVGISEPIPVCGHSMASLCALGLALDRPAIVRALLLIGTTTGPGAAVRSGGMPWCWKPWTSRFWAFNIRGARLALGLGNLAVQKKLCAQVFVRSYMDRRLAPVTVVNKGDRSRPASPRARWATNVRGIDYEPRLDELRLQVVVCAGRHDPQTTLAANQRVATAIREAKLMVFENSGHYPFIEDSASFAEVLREFRASLATAAPGTPRTSSR